MIVPLSTNCPILVSILVICQLSISTARSTDLSWDVGVNCNDYDKSDAMNYICEFMGVMIGIYL